MPHFTRRLWTSTTMINNPCCLIGKDRTRGLQGSHPIGVTKVYSQDRVVFVIALH